MNQTNESFRIFALWLAALFLTALGAQLWIVWLYGSPLPLWDQWYEAAFFKSWVAGDLKWTDFLAAHNEHRIFATRVLDIGLIWLNGRWEPLLQMAVNAFIHAAFACALAFCLWEFLGRKNGWLVCGLLMPFYALPYAGENAILGFNSQNYFVNIFALVTLVGLGFGKPGSWSWWIGLAAAVLGLFSMACGLLAPLAVGGLIVLRMMKNQRPGKPDLITLAVCISVVAIGAALNVTKEQDRAFQAHSFLEFTAALTRNLSWPFYNAPFMPVIIALPLALLAVFYLRPGFQQPRAAEFLLALALWSVLQSIATAYGRANYGGTIFPVSRYMDWFNIIVIAAIFAAVLLAPLWERYRLRNSLAAALFIALMIYGVCRISQIVVSGLLVQIRTMNLVAEERVERFLATGNKADLLERPTVPPDPQLTYDDLQDPRLQTILPVSCLPPGTPTQERFMGLTQWLLTHARVILALGLILFMGLCGYGVARGTPGLARGSVPGILALLAALAALGFVWSKHTVTRNSVEYQLQEQIAANFKGAGNLKRAAIHEQKAEALKQFAN